MSFLPSLNIEIAIQEEMRNSPLNGWTLNRPFKVSYVHCYCLFRTFRNPVEPGWYKRAFVSTMEFIDFSDASQWRKDRTSFEEEKKEKNQFVRTKMRPKEGTNIELQRDIS